MFANMGDKPLQTEYFSRMALAGFKGEAYGHTGQGFSYLWTALGAAMGGPQAATEYLKQLRWDRDMKRRCDGSFVYEGGEQWAPGKGNDYWDDSHIYWGYPTPKSGCVPKPPRHSASSTRRPPRRCPTCWVPLSGMWRQPIRLRKVSIGAIPCKSPTATCQRPCSNNWEAKPSRPTRTCSIRRFGPASNIRPACGAISPAVLCGTGWNWRILWRWPRTSSPMR